MKVMPLSANNDQLAKYDSAAWDQVSVTKVDLSGVPISMQPSSYIQSKWKDKPAGVTKQLSVSFARNSEVIACRLTWSDESKNLDRDDNNHFPDGAALMFPLKNDAPLIMMGSAEQPVNAWHWRADRATRGRNNVAAGFGSTRVTKGEEIITSATHRDGHWHLVLQRKLQANNPANAVSFTFGNAIKVAFAIWEGGNGERGGIKAFSPMWHELAID